MVNLQKPNKIAFAVVTTVLFLILFITSASFAIAARSEPIIIDHTCIDISQVPESWVTQAKSDFRLSYGHTHPTAVRL